MRRIFTLILTAIVMAATAWADTQSDLNRYLKDYNSQLAAKQYLPAARSAAAAAKICVEAKNYNGALKLLGNTMETLAARHLNPDSIPSVYYVLEKAQFGIYSKLNNMASAAKAITNMENYAKKANDKKLTSDLLFNEAQYYYATNQNKKGDQCISSLIKQYENKSDYKSADEAYQKLIANAVSANDAKMVEHTYDNYISWSDSIDAANANTELGMVKKQFADSQQTIAQKDSTIKARTGWIITFVTLFLISLAALGVGGLFYWRIMANNKRMRKNMEAANARSAAKSAILHNMSSQIAPTLDRLDQENPAVKNLKGYMQKVGELSDVENSTPSNSEDLKEIKLQPFCESIVDRIRPMLKPDVTVTLNGTKDFAKINAEEVEKILYHLLENAAKYTPAGGRISLTFKKRGAKVSQFIVTDSGPGIPKEEHETIFTAFSTPVDIAEGDHLGLPICALRAENLNGSLVLDPAITKGASFVLTVRA